LSVSIFQARQINLLVDELLLQSAGLICSYLLKDTHFLSLLSKNKTKRHPNFYVID